MKTHRFNGKTYDIDLNGRIDGFCESPRGAVPVLLLCVDLSTKAGLESAIHEGLHACNYMKKEESVKQAAKDVSRFLWRLGFRYDERTAR